MKYAIISDIHGNIFAFKKAMELIEQENVDKIICLGDVIGIGTRSDDCVKLIEKYNDRLIYVRGNHEDRFLFGVPEYIHNGEYKMKPDDIEQEHWIRDGISNESRAYLETIPKEMVTDLEGIEVAVTHYPLKNETDYEDFYSYPRRDELKRIFEKYDAKINLFGHTHIPLTTIHEGKWYINPGTLGTTDHRDYGTYGILTINNGEIFYVEKSFYYDLKSALDDFDVTNPPKKDHFRDKFFGYKRSSKI